MKIKGGMNLSVFYGKFYLLQYNKNKLSVCFTVFLTECNVVPPRRSTPVIIRLNPTLGWLKKFRWKRKIRTNTLIIILSRVSGI